MNIISSDEGGQLALWIDKNREEVNDAFRASGCVVFRGFDTEATTTLKDVLALFGGDPMDDARWSSPRHGVGDGAFTASEYPADQTIVLHSEMSYMRQWPRLLLFQCRQPASQGGATTIAKLKDVSTALAGLVDEFAERDVIYVRNFRKGVDIPWQDAFGTTDSKKVDAIAASRGIKTEWLKGGVLRTTQHAQGALDIAGDEGPSKFWFNQAHLFHPSRLPLETRSMMTRAFGEDGLPRTAMFGDGSVINDDTIKTITTVLETHTQPIDWVRGDVAIIDNMRWMHGRSPYQGERVVHATMGLSTGEWMATPQIGDPPAQKSPAPKQSWLKRLLSH